MRKIIADHFLTEFFITVKYNNNPLSLIIDSATNINDHHYIICLFCTVVNEERKVIFYRLINIGFDSTAKGIFDILVDNFEKGLILTDLIRRNLVGFICDAAPVFASNNNSVGKYLNRHYNVNKKLFKIKRFSHEFPAFLAKSYQISHFHYGHSYKRIEHLRSLLKRFE